MIKGSCVSAEWWKTGVLFGVITTIDDASHNSERIATNSESFIILF